MGHETRKGNLGVAEVERYLIKLVQLAAAGPKCRFWLVLFADRHLQVPTHEIKSGESAGTVEDIEQVVNPWQRVRILDGSSI